MSDSLVITILFYAFAVAVIALVVRADDKKHGR